MRISAKSEVRKKVSTAASDSWKELCKPYSEAKQPMLNHERLYAPFDKIIDYDNKQLREELIPLYRKILDIFTDKYWLADETTRIYYQDFLEFIEPWERFLAEALPVEVMRKLENSEKNVLAFFENIEQTLSALQEEINAKSFWKLRL